MVDGVTYKGTGEIKDASNWLSYEGGFEITTATATKKIDGVDVTTGEGINFEDGKLTEEIGQVILNKM